MYNQGFQATFSQPEDISLLNPFAIDKKNIKNYIDLTTHIFGTIKNSELFNPIKQGSQNLSSLIEPVNENQVIYASNIIDTSSCFWVSYANEQMLSPISVYPKREKRLSTEIVKKYSLSKNVQKIYFSEVSFYVNVDVLLNTELISDKELNNFFDYEQELLDIFDTPMNFNYRPKNSYYPHSENNVLIFKK